MKTRSAWMIGALVAVLLTTTALPAQVVNAPCGTCTATNTVAVGGNCGACLVITNVFPPFSQNGNCIWNTASKCVLAPDNRCQALQSKKLSVSPACPGTTACIREWTNYPAVPATASPPRCFPVVPGAGDFFLQTGVGTCDAKDTKVYGIWATPVCPALCPPVTVPPTCWMLLESKCTRCQ